MKVIFRDQSQLLWTRRWCWIIRWLAEENQHISSITDDMGLMSGKGPGEMAAISSTGDVQVDTFLYSNGGLLMLSSFFWMMMHLCTQQRGFKLDFSKDTSAQWHGQQTVQISVWVQLYGGNWKKCSVLQSWSASCWTRNFTNEVLQEFKLSQKTEELKLSADWDSWFIYF